MLGNYQSFSLNVVPYAGRQAVTYLLSAAQVRAHATSMHATEVDEWEWAWSCIRVYGVVVRSLQM